MNHLRRAEVSQSYQSRDQYWSDVYRLEGIDGTSNHGDSGGPFIVNGKLVGINILASHVADNYWIGEVSGALQLRPFVSWIEQETGGKAVPFAQAPRHPLHHLRADADTRDRRLTDRRGRRQSA